MSLRKKQINCLRDVYADIILKQYDNAASKLMIGFTWEYTPEGSRYWWTVWRALKRATI